MPRILEFLESLSFFRRGEPVGGGQEPAVLFHGHGREGSFFMMMDLGFRWIKITFPD
jgi:hypothetical protein